MGLIRKFFFIWKQTNKKMSSLQFLRLSLNSEVSENRASLCVIVFQGSEGIQESQHPYYPGELPLVSPMTVSKPLFILFSLDVYSLHSMCSPWIELVSPGSLLEMRNLRSAPKNS